MSHPYNKGKTSFRIPQQQIYLWYKKFTKPWSLLRARQQEKKQSNKKTRKEGDFTFSNVLELSSPQKRGLSGSICWPLTGSNHDVKSNYHHGALLMCEGKTARAQFFIMPHIPEGQLKELRVTDLWKCQQKNVSWCPHNWKQKE